MIYTKTAGLLGVLLITLTAQSRADDVCQVVKPLESNAYIVAVNGKKLTAITEDMAREALKTKAELEAAKARIAADEALIETLQKAKDQYDKVVQNQREYITGLEKARDGYRDLAKDYKKLTGGSALSLDVGLGATGSETNPAAFVGLGLWKVRVWGFIQESNSGVIVGTSLPLL